MSPKFGFLMYFFQKSLVYYENVSDCKPSIGSGAFVLHRSPAKLVLRCSKLFKFSFGMGLPVESGGRVYSKSPNVRKLGSHMKKTDVHFFHIWQF